MALGPLWPPMLPTVFPGTGSWTLNICPTIYEYSSVFTKSLSHSEVCRGASGGTKNGSPKMDSGKKDGCSTCAVQGLAAFGKASAVVGRASVKLLLAGKRC